MVPCETNACLWKNKLQSSAHPFSFKLPFKLWSWAGNPLQLIRYAGVSFKIFCLPAGKSIKHYYATMKTDYLQINPCNLTSLSLPPPCIFTSVLHELETEISNNVWKVFNPQVFSTSERGANKVGFFIEGHREVVPVNAFFFFYRCRSLEMMGLQIRTADVSLPADGSESQIARCTHTHWLGM